MMLLPSISTLLLALATLAPAIAAGPLPPSYPLSEATQPALPTSTVEVNPEVPIQTTSPPKTEEKRGWYHDHIEKYVNSAASAQCTDMFGPCD